MLINVYLFKIIHNYINKKKKMRLKKLKFGTSDSYKEKNHLQVIN